MSNGSILRTGFRCKLSILESAGKEPRDGPERGLETRDSGDIVYEE
jgi:hypothetical protein